jgi:polyphosphate glucokinase
MKYKQVLGIDFGGSGIKGAPVKTKTGKLTEPRFRIPTPPSATPENVVPVIKEIVEHFKWEGAVGIGFPSVVLNGVIKTAANISDEWIGIDAEKVISDAVNLPVCIVNDADSAGLAEIKFGAGHKIKGTIMLVTIGTGLGTVLFTKGKLVANTELGHMYLPNGQEAEAFASDAVRQDHDLSWEQWAKRFDEYLQEIERLFWPELIILGGGASKKSKEFSEFFTVKTPIVMAKQKNEAGIIGAALAAKIYLKNRLSEE